MLKISESLIVIFLFVITSEYYCLAATDLTYTAAVVEYKPIAHDASTSYDELCVKNVAKYIEIIRSANRALDIVVFPEATITTLTAFNHREVLIDIAANIPEVGRSVNPCDSDEFPRYLRNVSCAARELNMYIVVNTVEKAECAADTERDNENCTERWNLYNTNVIFDRDGDVIAKYRKFHLFHEPQNRHTKNPELVTFDTDFGVKFGTFVCFDILFEEPGMSLVRQGVRHFVYPTMWFAEVPFVTALQAQHMWAVGNDVVLLAANANNPKVGGGGSGIYQGLRGPSDMEIVSEGGTKLIMAEVYKNVGTVKSDGRIDESTDEIDRKGAKMDGFMLHMDTLKPYTSYKIDGNLDATYCHKHFCCHFKVAMEKRPTASPNYYRYRAMVFSGVRSFHGPTNGGLEICAVVFCKNDSKESCAERIVPYSEVEWPTTFTELEITATYGADRHRMQFPDTLLSSFEPMQADNYEWTADEANDGTTVKRKLKLLTPQNRLLVFAMFGRDYSRDEDPADVAQHDKIEL